jgi:thioesterase domain-containing protein/3-oxoacyl-(acyl-carrier-protein) synthase/acyl carrier protein/enoyl-[acyl-carrier-protein] reductase (NADH)
VRLAEKNGLTVSVYDGNGHPLVELEGLTFDTAPRVLDAKTNLSLSLTTEDEDRQASAARVELDEENHELLTFEEVWQKEPLPERALAAPKTLVCFVTEATYQRRITELLQGLSEETEIILVSRGTGYQADSATHYLIDAQARDDFEKVFAQLGQSHGQIDAVLYLEALEGGDVADCSGIVYLLQSLSSAQLSVKRVVLAAEYADAVGRCHIESWLGFERSIGQILADTRVNVVFQAATGGDVALEDWMERLWWELRQRPQSVHYQGHRRQVCTIRETPVMAGGDRLKAGGCYLITGGCGGLGRVFAAHLAKTRQAHLILTGSTPLDERKEALIRELEALGGQALYQQADVCERAQMERVRETAQGRFGGIDGVLHVAGIGSGAKGFAHRPMEEFRGVIAPKVKGSLVIDEVFAHEDLDFICYFSSSAALLGDFGSCDYAIANRFQMAYASHRPSSSCPCIAINWPLWKAGGMGFRDDEASKMYLKSSGQQALETHEGIAVFERLLAQASPHQLVLMGQPSRIHRFLGLSGVSQATAATDSAVVVLGKRRRPEMRGLGVDECLAWDLKEHISRLQKIPRERLDIQTNLADFGFDSISLSELARLLSQYYGVSVLPSIFFGYSTIEKLGAYLLEEYAEELEAFYRLEVETPLNKPSLVEESALRRFSKASRFLVPPSAEGPWEPIAIIGMSGQFPMSEDIGEYWKNIMEGRDCITEIPGERWDWKAFYGESVNNPNNTTIKWGGFIDDVKYFDPLFFDINPKSAELIDPQQRLLMSYIWKAMEDSGYTRKSLSKKSTGVFTAVTHGEYERIAPTATMAYMIPNRISHFFDLNGPSEYCDTGCSSGLVAVHRAIKAIHNKECEQAIVGAVNLLLTPTGYSVLERFGILSKKGKARSFQKGSDGYVRSEGVAAIILKPLSDALKDKDNIYALIKGTGVVHGGKNVSFTAPNFNGIKDAMKQAFSASNIDSGSVSYIEAQGVASPLADAIEIEALKTGYKELLQKNKGGLNEKKKCYIGSLKPVIGHGEVVSGLAALIKVVLAIKNRTILGVPDFTSLNENISLQGSAFEISPQNVEWLALKDSDGNDIPLRSSVNSFGMGGVNAHLVLEEFVSNDYDKRYSINQSESKQIICFSAKNMERLQASIRQAKKYLDNYNEFLLKDLAYTLQVGREEMEVRFAMVVCNKEELNRGINKYLNSVEHKCEMEDEIPIFIGNATDNATYNKNWQETLNNHAQTELKTRDYTEVARLWVGGGVIQWDILHDDSVRKISLNTYPFEKYLCWSVSNNANLKIDGALSALKVIEKVLGLNVAEVDINKDLSHYGVDSIVYMELFQQLQQFYGKQFNIEEIMECKTLKEIINIIPVASDDKYNISVRNHNARLYTHPELVLLNEIFIGRPIFWIHAGFGGVEIYHEFAQKFERPFYGLQARGWLDDEPPLVGIYAMAQHYASILMTVQPDGPFDIGGYSLGGLLSYEVTRILQMNGRKVHTITMIDSFDNTQPKTAKVSKKTLYLQNVNAALGSLILSKNNNNNVRFINRSELDKRLDDEKYLNGLIALARKRGLRKSPRQLHEQIKRMVKVQSSYELDAYSLSSLTKPNEVNCYYFRNRGSIFFGGFEPYFTLNSKEMNIDRDNYWKKWHIYLPNINMIDVKSENHFTILSDPRAAKTIMKYCKTIYRAEKQISHE